jgi:hypothetical protein
MRSGDNEDIPDPSQHKDGDGIIDHRFIEDREQLFAYTFCDGVKTGAASAG